MAVLGDEPWDSVEFTSAQAFGLAPEELGERVLATVLFSDIVGSTAMVERAGRPRLGGAPARAQREDPCRDRSLPRPGDRRRRRRLPRALRRRREGRARGALMDPTVAELGLRVRVGLHTSEVEIVGGQARGVGVHAAARVAALAGPGEVLVSGTTHDLLDGSGLSLEPRGEHELKGLTGARADLRAPALGHLLARPGSYRRCDSMRSLVEFRSTSKQEQREMFSHIMVGANDIEASKKFYDAVLGALGIRAEPGTTRVGSSTSPRRGSSRSRSRSTAPRRPLRTAEPSGSPPIPREGQGLACRRHRQRRHQHRGPAGRARQRNGPALPRLSPRSGRQQDLRAPPHGELIESPGRRRHAAAEGVTEES